HLDLALHSSLNLLRLQCRVVTNVGIVLQVGGQNHLTQFENLILNDSLRQTNCEKHLYPPIQAHQIRTPAHFRSSESEQMIVEAQTHSTKYSDWRV
ncbi:MAG: hypothetical protein EBZ23_05225, partial [Rhodobacteraceae bacterium]|nr:hypothetical protein [Paracoccaceae bacterium]